jgi:hypothetical protein
VGLILSSQPFRGKFDVFNWWLLERDAFLEFSFFFMFAVVLFNFLFVSRDLSGAVTAFMSDCVGVLLRFCRRYL